MTVSLSVSAQGQSSLPLPKPSGAATATSQLASRYFSEARQAADNVRVDYSKQAKAHARETVERLRKQISELSLVAALNPKGVARMVRTMARELSMAAKEYGDSGDTQASTTETDAAAATPRESLAAAYLRNDPHADDTRFADDVQRMHRMLTIMMEGAVSGAKTETPDPELHDIATGFAESGKVIDDAIATIQGWGNNTAVTVPFVPGSGGVLV
jgi:hypothetical protein